MIIDFVLRNITLFFYFFHDVYNLLMGIYEENYLAKRPQHLCKMCGKCCRVVTTSVPYSELKEKAESGDKGAIDFLSLFVPYNSIEAARKVDAATVDNIINRLKSDGNFDENNITFYGCKYLQDNNLCGRYETRLDLCRHCPSTPWSIVPPDCGFEGWLFWQREEAKQKVRKSKEELCELKLLRMRAKNEDTIKKIDAIEQKILKGINLYKKYGSENW